MFKLFTIDPKYFGLNHHRHRSLQYIQAISRSVATEIRGPISDTQKPAIYSYLEPHTMYV